MAQNPDAIKQLVSSFENDLEDARRDSKGKTPFKLGPLKVEAAHGVLMWWAGEGNSWIHPDDVELAHELIPSKRIFMRVPYDMQYYLFKYGEIEMRLRPVLWRKVKTDGFEIGDQIEINSDLGRRAPFIGTIAEILWDNRKKEIHYRVSRNGAIVGKEFYVHEFKPTMRLDGEIDARTLELMNQHRFA